MFTIKYSSLSLIQMPGKELHEKVHSLSRYYACPEVTQNFQATFLMAEISD